MDSYEYGYFSPFPRNHRLITLGSLRHLKLQGLLMALCLIPDTFIDL